MAYKTKLDIQQDIDFYFNDGVAINSIKPTTTGNELTDIIDSYLHIDSVVDNLNSTIVNQPLSANQGKVLNDKILAMAGSLIAQGNWNADTNVPDITGTTNAGYFWIVDTDGATDLGGITDWKVNDWAVYTSNGWAKVDNTDKVTSINGASGNVVLNADDIEDSLTTHKFVTEGQRSQISINTSNINTNSSDIATKANQSALNTTNSNVATNTSNININAIGITLKANQSDLDNYLPLTGGTLTGQLNANGNINNGNGYYYTQGVANRFIAQQANSYFAWAVNGDSTEVMKLDSNGQLILEEQLNVNNLISQTSNGNVLEIGAKNSIWCHFISNYPFFFDNRAEFNGRISLSNSTTLIDINEVTSDKITGLSVSNNGIDTKRLIYTGAWDMDTDEGLYIYLGGDSAGYEYIIVDFWINQVPSGTINSGSYWNRRRLDIDSNSSTAIYSQGFSSSVGAQTFIAKRSAGGFFDAVDFANATYTLILEKIL